MKLYVDCSLPACAPQVRRKYIKSMADFESQLRGVGYVVLNYETPRSTLGFNPFESEISDFVQVSDAVLLFQDPHQELSAKVSFSSMAVATSNLLRKPRIICIPRFGGMGGFASSVIREGTNEFRLEYSNAKFFNRVMRSLSHGELVPELATATG